MSIHDKTQSIWEELVRIRETMALDSYARQLRECEKGLGSLDKVPTRLITKHAERVMLIAEEIDKVRTETKRRAFPLEHL
jgi:hypothetical protein